MKKSIILGNFDGVHIAHKKLIESACQKGNSTAFIFDKHPSTLLGKSVPVIMPNSIKKEIIEDLGCQVHFEPLTSEILATEPESFVRDILCKNFAPDFVFAGYNYTFGKNGAGGADDLKAYGKKYGFSVEIIDEIKFMGKTVSSTLVRELLQNGDIESANKILSKPYRIRAKVTKGKKLGRTLGFPTINTEFEENLVIPAFGVYVSNTIIEGKAYKSITNIGTNPTVENAVPRAESYIFDFSEDLYGKTVDVILLKKLRDEKKFSGKEELMVAVKEDINTAKKFLNKMFDK